jgi:hypothetical protein
MTAINIELLDALKKAGVDEETARAAAKAVLGIEEREKLATKADLEQLRLTVKADIAELKAEIQAMLNRQLQVMMGMMIAMTGIFAAIVKLF